MNINLKDFAMTECKQEIFGFQVMEAQSDGGTLNRLELGALGGDTRYKKIIASQEMRPC